jgi:hypothetical protein
MGVLRVLVGADVITWTEYTSLWLCCRHFEIVMAANDMIDAAFNPGLAPSTNTSQGNRT